MHSVTDILRAGSWRPETASDRIVLSFDERHRRRLRYVAAGGTIFLLDLPRATVLQAGDGLRLDDGRVVGVEAAPEPLLAVTAHDPSMLVRLAWHLGNRHLPARLEAHRILIRDDAVIAAMLRGLGATVESVLAAFTPEPGAYDTAAAGAAGHHEAGHEDVERHHHE